MKLHLTKSLRAALIACVCGGFAVTSQAMAEALVVGADETVSKNVDTDTFNSYESVTVEGTLNLSATSDINSNQTIVLSGGTLNLNNSWGTRDADTSDQGTVTVDGSGTISGSDKALYTTINGTGDLTLQGGSGNLYVYGDISNDGDLNLGAKVNIGGSWGYNGGANFTNVTSKGDLNVNGNAWISSGATVNVGGSINVAEGSTLTTEANSVLVLDQAVSTSGNLTLQGTVQLGAGVLDSLTTADVAAWSNGDSGFYADGTSYSGLISTTGTLKVENASVKLSDTETVAMNADGSFTVLSSHDGNYYVNSDLDLKTAEMEEAAQILVSEGKTVTIKSGTCDDLNKNVTLAAGSTLNLKNRSAQNNVKITLDGDANISMYGTSMRGDVEGSGNLTLKQNSGNVAYIKGDINNTGTVTIEGHVQFQKDESDIGTIGSNVDAVIVGAGNTLVLENAQVNSFDLELSGTGKVEVINSSTLVLGADSSVTGGTMSVADNSTLDLSNVVTLNVTSFSLAAGTTVILGENTRINFSEALTIGEGVVFDLSGWCSYNEFEPYALFTYTGDVEGYTPSLPENVTILLDGGYVDDKAWLEYDVDNKTVTLIPEPTTATLSLLALAGLAARRRRK